MLDTSNMIKINFERDTPYGKYQDALYVPNPNPYTPEEIQAMEDERVAKWIYDVENPPPAPNPPVEVEVDGYTYYLIVGPYPSDAIIIEVNGYWYYRSPE